MEHRNTDDESLPLPALTPRPRRVLPGFATAIGGFLGAVVGGFLLDGFGVFLGTVVGTGIALLAARRVAP